PATTLPRLGQAHRRRDRAERLPDAYRPPARLGEAGQGRRGRLRPQQIPAPGGRPADQGSDTEIDLTADPVVSFIKLVPWSAADTADGAVRLALFRDEPWLLALLGRRLPGRLPYARRGEPVCQPMLQIQVGRNRFRLSHASSAASRYCWS